MFRKLAAALLLALVATIACAAGATATVTITAPTAYADGEAMPLTDLATYTITWSPSGSQKGPSGSKTIAVSGATTSTTVPVPCGSTSFAATVTTTSTALYPSAPSDASTPSVAYVTGIVCKPNPPGVAAS